MITMLKRLINVSQEGRGCLVADQGGSDRVALFKIDGRGVRTRSSPIGSAHVIVHRVWKENGILSLNLLFKILYRTNNV